MTILQHKNLKRRNRSSIKQFLIITVLIFLSCKMTFAAESITIETKYNDLFENIVSDTILLLDPELKKNIITEFGQVVANSKFQAPVNSWKPRSNPKIKLESIYSDIDLSNITESFSALVKPVVELACTPQQYDPINEVWVKCIKNMFKYPVNDAIEINYKYDHSKTTDQFVSELKGLNNQNRYQQIVKTMADILNSSFERVRKNTVAMHISVVKNPIPLVAASSYSPESITNNQIMKTTRKGQIQKGMSKMDVQRILGKPDMIDIMPSGTNNKFEEWTYAQAGKEDLVILFFTGGRTTEVYQINGK